MAEYVFSHYKHANNLYFVQLSLSFYLPYSLSLPLSLSLCLSVCLSLSLSLSVSIYFSLSLPLPPSVSLSLSWYITDTIMRLVSTDPESQVCQEWYSEALCDVGCSPWCSSGKSRSMFFMYYNLMKKGLLSRKRQWIYIYLMLLTGNLFNTGCSIIVQTHLIYKLWIFIFF